MEIIFLGTSAGIPTRSRNVSGLALRPEQSVGWLLFDCGEATQHQIMKSRLSLYRLERIFITHLHGDHVYGLFGLLASRGMLMCETPLEIYGPPGLKRMLTTVMEHSQLRLPFDLSVTELEGSERLDFGSYRIEPVAMSHSITCYGYAFIEKERPGRLDRRRAADLGIPEGPMLGELKAGRAVTLPDGRIVEAAEVLSSPRPGRRILIGGDNDDPERFSPYAGADLLVHETTYTQRDFERLPRKFMHTTALQLGCAAKKMKIKALAATHFSARYDTGERMNEIEEEIRECYEGTLYLASDLMQIEV